MPYLEQARRAAGYLAPSCANFNGSTQWLVYEIGDYINYPFTIANWQNNNNVNSFNGTLALCNSDASGGDRQAHSLLHGSGIHKFDSRNQTNATNADGPSATNQIWSHHAGVGYFPGSRICFGNAIAGSENTTVRFPLNLHNVIIGNHYIENANTAHTGELCGIAIYNCALTHGELARLTAGENPLNVRGSYLCFYVPLTDGIYWDVINGIYPSGQLTSHIFPTWHISSDAFPLIQDYIPERTYFLPAVAAGNFNDLLAGNFAFTGQTLSTEQKQELANGGFTFTGQSLTTKQEQQLIAPDFTFAGQELTNKNAQQLANAVFTFAAQPITLEQIQKLANATFLFVGRKISTTTSPLTVTTWFRRMFMRKSAKMGRRR